MTDTSLDHIKTEMTPEAEAALLATMPEPVIEPVQAVEAEPTNDDTHDPQEAVETDPEVSEQEPDDIRDKRIARLAHDVREKNRKLTAQQAEIDRLKGSRQETRDQEIDRLADERSLQKVKEREFVNACADVLKNGNAAYGDSFKRAVDSLNDVCADAYLTNAVIECVLESAGKDSHMLIKHLGENPDILEDIVAMPPHRQGAAIAREAAKIATPKLRPLSKAPAPIKAVKTSSTTSTTAFDPANASMDEFVKWARAKDKERGWI